MNQSMSDRDVGGSRERADNLIVWLRDYAERHINSRLIDERKTIPPSIVLDFGRRGILSLQVAQQYGGAGLTYTDSTRVIAQLAAIDLTLAVFAGLNQVLGIRPIQRFARPQLRETLLPLLGQGRALAAFALTEPGAGSNPHAMKAQAVPDGQGGWRLRGEKIWSGSAAWAEAINVFVRLFDEQQRPRGIAAFVVLQDSLGLRQGPEAPTMGVRGMVQNQIVLADVPVGPEHLLGEAGQGMLVAQDAMMLGRWGIAAICVGGMQRCLQLVLRYARRRTIATGRLLNHPLFQAEMSDLTAAVNALECLVLWVAQTMDAEQRVPPEVSLTCKIVGPEWLWWAADRTTQFLGGRGYIETNALPQLLRDARLLRVFEGPTETLCAALGAILREQPDRATQVLREDFGAAALADETHAMLDDCIAHARLHTQRFASSWAFLQWHMVKMGELLAAAIVLAAVNSAPSVHLASERERVVQWATERFTMLQQRLAAELTAASPILQSAALEQTIDAYTAAIGDIEQAQANEEQVRDNLLRREQALD